MARTERRQSLFLSLWPLAWGRVLLFVFPAPATVWGFHHQKPLAWGRVLLCVCLLLSCAPPAGKKACQDDKQCPLGEFCDQEIQRCQKGCTGDDRCPQGQSCYQQKCAAIVCGPRATPPTSNTEECLTTAEGKVQRRDPQQSLQGTCRYGVRQCSHNAQVWSACRGEVRPRPEVCDGQDNDCDGQTDEDLGEACRCFPGDWRRCDTSPPETKHASPQSLSLCRPGIQFCTSQGRWGACLQQILPFSNEEARRSCLDLDADCNGALDDNPACRCPRAGETRPCYTGPAATRGVGLCKEGRQTCRQTCLTAQKPLASCPADQVVLRWGFCEGQVLPTPEEWAGCNGKDEDCDGSADNSTLQPQQGLTRLCYPEKESGCSQNDGVFQCQGACRPGTQNCQKGSLWSSCQQALRPQAERCNNKDDNCNGQVDEDCSP